MATEKAEGCVIGCGCLLICLVAYGVIVGSCNGAKIQEAARGRSSTPAVVLRETATPPPRPSSCAEAFEVAAGAMEYQGTHEDLFPAYSVCKSINEWREAYALHPEAIDGGNPVQYAMAVCANRRGTIGQTPICKAVNPETARSEVAARALETSGRTGLLGVPLPSGARLTERIPGNPFEYTDPSETYAISADAGDITAFFNREMPKAGWRKSASGMFIEFRKGNRVLGVYISNNKFTLMGS